MIESCNLNYLYNYRAHPNHVTFVSRHQQFGGGGGEGGQGCQQGEWYVYDARLVLPEYLVTVSYIPVNERMEKEEDRDEMNITSDEDIISSPPSPTQRLK